jgi:hypothetical protein
MCPVIAIGIAKVEREMKTTVRVESVLGHIVEALRTLPVSFSL